LTAPLKPTRISVTWCFLFLTSWTLERVTSGVDVGVGVGVVGVGVGGVGVGVGVVGVVGVGVGVVGVGVGVVGVGLGSRYTSGAAAATPPG
jgi:hypothetical protein